MKDEEERAILWGIEEPEWPEKAKSAGVSINTYAQYKVAVSGLSADKDGNGKSVSGSLKKKQMAAIDALDITKEQKDALYLAEGMARSTIGEAPWR